VVERVPQGSVGDRYLELVAAGARVVPQVVVGRLVLRGDLGRGGEELADRPADERVAVDSEVRLPGAVGAEMLAVACLEENRDGQGLDQLLRDVQGLGALLPDSSRHSGRRPAGMARLQGARDVGEELLAPAAVLGGLDAVMLTDG